MLHMHGKIASRNQGSWPYILHNIPMGINDVLKFYHPKGNCFSPEFLELLLLKKIFNSVARKI